MNGLKKFIVDLEDTLKEQVQLTVFAVLNVMQYDWQDSIDCHIFRSSILNFAVIPTA